MKLVLRHRARSVVGTALLGAIGTLGAGWACERGAPGQEAAASGAGNQTVLHLGVAGSGAGANAANTPAAVAAVSAQLAEPAESNGTGGSAGAESRADSEGAESGSPRTAREAAKTEASGVPSASCVKGWITPARGTALRKAALDMIRATASERFGVVEMRYFVGPEDAEVLSPQHEIERWYVKAYSLSDPERRQRWLVRRAPVGRGVDAVAPFESHGYGPRTWRRVDATDESLADPFLRPCNQSKPGSRCMGLPRAVLGCLAGT